MAIGDVFDVPGVDDLHYVDTGMYDVPEYGSVYVWTGERPAVVDTGIGTNYDLLREALRDLGVGAEDLRAVAVTHVHLDHAGGAGFLARDHPNATVHVHEIGAAHLVDPERLWEGTRRAVGDQFRHYVEPDPVPADRVRQLTDGDRIDLGDGELVAHHAPGHAPHQVVFHEPDADALFTADAAGIYVPARDAVVQTTPPPNFDFEQAVADVRLCGRIDPGTLCYAHFGPAPADDRLAAYVDVLTEWVEAIAAARDELGDDEAVVERFVADADLGGVWGADKAEPETAMNVRGVLRYLDEREDGR